MIYSIFGWTGTALIIGAYLLNSTNVVASTSMLYQLMNLFGAIGMLINVWHTRTWSAVALQVIWGLITIWAIMNSLLL